MCIIVILSSLGALFGWVALSYVMAMPSLLFAFGVGVIMILSAFSAYYAEKIERGNFK